MADNLDLTLIPHSADRNRTRGQITKPGFKEVHHTPKFNRTDGARPAKRDPGVYITTVYTRHSENLINLTKKIGGWRIRTSEKGKPEGEFAPAKRETGYERGPQMGAAPVQNLTAGARNTIIGNIQYTY